jgi:hypothetical protein
MGAGVGKFPSGASKRVAGDRLLPKSPPYPSAPSATVERKPESRQEEEAEDEDEEEGEEGREEMEEWMAADEEAERDYPAHLRRLRAALAHSTGTLGTFCVHREQ